MTLRPGSVRLLPITIFALASLLAVKSNSVGPSSGAHA